MAAIPIIAHRTLPLDEAENSLAGIRKAGEFEADGVEVDIHLTLDRAVVLMHDLSLLRTTWVPWPVSLCPLFLLRRARLRGSDEPVPLLGEALDALPKGLIMAIEVKDHRAAPATLRVVRERGLESRVLFWSYREPAVRYFAKEAPAVESALLRDDNDPEGLSRILSDASAWGARAISAHWSAITPQFIAEAHDRGLKCYARNRDLETVAKKVAAGLDGVVTNQPREVRAILEGTAAGSA